VRRRPILVEVIAVGNLNDVTLRDSTPLSRPLTARRDLHGSATYRPRSKARRRCRAAIDSTACQFQRLDQRGVALERALAAARQSTGPHHQASGFSGPTGKLMVISALRGEALPEENSDVRRLTAFVRDVFSSVEHENPARG
jgi:hypothetical protein